MITIWSNRKQEDSLRELGFNIPKYPKTGNILVNDNIVGYADNFNGLTIKNDESIKIIKNSESRLNLCIWNN